MQVFTENFIRTRKIELFALISHKKQQKTCTVKLKCLPLHSLKKKHNGAIAQLVEQRTENPCVPGSIPGGTTRKNFSLLKSSEIQQFRRIFYFCHLQKNADLRI